MRPAHFTMASVNCIRRFAKIPAVGLFSVSPRGINRFSKHPRALTKYSRFSTDSQSSFNVEKHDGFGIITLTRKPVNSLNLQTLTEFINVIDELESDKSCQGLILTSGIPKIFSAGLDIKEFLQEDRGRLEQFWHSFQEIWLKLYGTRLATIAAINGASVAGGCLLAISCDYRLMADGFVIGTNETQLGIVAPSWFMDTLVNTVGFRKTEHLLNLGQLLSSKEAEDIGLVDRVVEGDVLDAAKDELKKWLSIPAEARTTTKLMLRNPTLDKLRKARAEDLKLFMDFTCQESTQKIIAGYLKKLGKK